MNLSLKIYLLFDPRKPMSSEELKNLRPNNILLFSNTALGDTLLSTPAIDSLRMSFPQAHITLFISKNTASLFAGHPSVDRFIVYHGGFRKFLSTLLQLRHTKPDIAMLLHSNGPQDIPMALFSGAPVILKTPTKSLYAHLLTLPSEDKDWHVIESRLDLVRTIGGQKITTRMSLPPRYERTAHRKYLPQNTKVIGFQMGAANTYKMWPAERFAELAVKLLAYNENIVIALTGTKKESHLASFVINACGDEKVFNLCGLCTIEELPHLASEFDLLVTNDTGTMHIAIALGVPSVELFGATGAAHTGAYQDTDKHRIISKEVSGSYYETSKKKRSNEPMTAISVEDVFNAIQSLL
jgi:ADP-heptose:LPS heptosyltransferase